MSHVVRTSIIIDGNRLQDTQFSSVSLSQTIGWHHSFGIRLRQNANKGVLAKRAKSWISKTISIGFDITPDKELMQAPVKEVFKGVITSVGLARRSGTAELVINGKSPTIAADDGSQMHSYTDKSLLEITDQALSKYKDAFSETPIIDPKNFTTSIPYTVQYKESCFTFLARLANRYGEWFYYDGLKLYFGKPAASNPVKLDFSDKGLIDFDISVQAIAAKFEMQAYDYIKHKPLKETSPLKKDGLSDLGKEVLSIATGQIYSKTTSAHINEATNKEELKNLTERKEQVLLDEMEVLKGSSRNPKIRIGAIINVNDNEIGENYGDFIIINITHNIGQGGNYTNHFEAIPASMPTPPLSTLPTPPFCETQLAKVTDVEDEEGLGRVKVEFPWQAGSGETSPWLRVASPYSGKDKGFYIIPEVEDQVLIAFENSNPDKPYVLTGMYNGDAKPEWFDGKNYYKGFKSKGQNQWKFDDKNKSILIDAPSSITMSAGKKITIKTGGEEDSEINIDTGMGKVYVVAKEVTVEAAEVINLNSQKEINASAIEKIKLDSSQELTANGNTKVGITSAQVKVEASAKSEIKGGVVDVSGSGPVNVKGMPIKLN